MSSLDLARWQFGIVTVYHYLFVPLTIGLSVLVALMQTRWHRTGDERWLRMTKFWGKLFLINFALGVVTGIVQEFQFGMNWRTTAVTSATSSGRRSRWKGCSPSSAGTGCPSACTWPASGSPPSA